MTVRGATLSRVIQTAADRSRLPATDRDLLRRFAEAGDQAAFEAVVRRHTGLVLGVCRRALSHAQDAEDACQATFLILARKARSGRWQPSIANWLFATARRVARDLRRASDRRAKREGRAAVPETVVVVDQMTGRELLAVIDEELDRLPPIYREPLLLYYQAELARDEIAARLGVPAGTVKIRLERGRKRLGDALTRRGVMLSIGLLTLMATSRAGASPSRLVEAIRAAVGGKAPPAVAALAEGAAVNGFIKNALLGVVALAAAAVVGLGLEEPRATTAGQQPEKAMPAKAAAKTDAPADKAEKKVEDRTITGKVLDPDGKPVAGAEIVHQPREAPPAVVGKSATDGTFSVTVPLKSPGSYLFPRVAGFATNEFLMPATNTPAEITYKLVKDTPIRGRVLDTQGKPVVGASVAVRSIERFENDSLDGYLAGFQKRPSDGYPPSPKWWADFGPGDRKLPAGEPVLAATTDADGRFTITGVGPERVATLRLAGPGIAVSQVVVLTRAGFDPTPYNRETLEKLKATYHWLGYHPMLYPPDAAVVAEAEKLVRGVVTDAGTGKPRAGVTVALRDPRNHRMPDLSAKTDAAGRYEIHGAKKTAEYELEVKRDAQAGFIGRRVKARDTPAYEPVTADIPTAKGVVLTGRLLDAQTGKPVPGFVHVGVLYDNESAKDRPEFDSPDCYDRASTDKDGVYRTVVPPGPVLLMAGVLSTSNKGPTESMYRLIRTDPDHPQYFDDRLGGFRSPGNSTTVMQGQWCKVLKLNPDQAEATVDVRFERASRFEVRVRGADGKPLSGVLAAGTTALDWSLPEECKGDICIVHELEHAKPRFLAFLEPKRSLVGTLTLKGNEKEPEVVTLGPAGRVKGKLANAAGQPIANAVVQVGYAHRAAGEINRRVYGDWRFSERTVETNAAGEFAIDVVIPGEKFAVHARKKEKFLEPTDRTPRFTVKPGEEKDLGTITMKEQ
ncbi:MAG TPA: sigma-70 family RNA polymerase sigma factor [Gemmataceae bacterium]|nr:sigma-70 family RNA polymerase sigma factor [Gemmataceae bacterium]